MFVADVSDEILQTKLIFEFSLPAKCRPRQNVLSAVVSFLRCLNVSFGGGGGDELFESFESFESFRAWFVVVLMILGSGR
eukprot:TRINITY_DN3276_c2_g1_i10.p2 TRINITY_DN3276_c2_g1~~TRINITY_DN3276_c2_g1_i10.p2  ORF type:complete len:80 (-),score=7.45 TRINITY_DN3276_c2_g1_i10:1273-1512(-)